MVYWFWNKTNSVPRVRYCYTVTVDWILLTFAYSKHGRVKRQIYKSIFINTDYSWWNDIENRTLSNYILSFFFSWLITVVFFVALSHNNEIPPFLLLPFRILQKASGPSSFTISIVVVSSYKPPTRFHWYLFQILASFIHFPHKISPTSFINCFESRPLCTCRTHCIIK